MTTEAERRIWRASLQPAALLTFEELLEALPGATASWARKRIPPRGEVDGRPVFVWGDVLQALGTEEAPRFDIDHSTAARRLQVHPRTLTRKMKLTPPGEEIWINRGAPSQPRYRWRSGALLEWWEKMCQVSGGETRSGRSDGRVQTAAPEAAPPAPPKKRAPSRARSTRTRGPSTSQQSLAAWVREELAPR